MGGHKKKGHTSPEVVPAPPPADNWVSADANDSPIGWLNGSLARDGKPPVGYTEAECSPGAVGWSEFLVLDLDPPFLCDKIRYYIGPEGQATQVDIDISQGDIWEDLYEGPITRDAWQVKPTPQVQIYSIARVRFYFIDVADYDNLAELQFNKLS